MNRKLFTHLFLWCIVLGFAFTTVAQNLPSVGRAPIVKQGSVNYGTHIDGVTSGYGGDAFVMGWDMIDIPSGTITPVGTISDYHQGGDFDGSGTFYATMNTSQMLLTVDLATGAETNIAPITGVTGGQTITALAWNPANNTMYMGTTDITTSQLYTLDLSTAVATLVGTIGQPGLIAMGINCAGEIYSFDIVTDELWSIDPSTGAGTVVGPLGADLNYAQDADFDFATNTLYLAGYNLNTGGGEFFSADLSTGALTSLMIWGSVEFTDFGIEGTCGPPCPIDPPSNPSPADGSMDVSVDLPQISWTNGAGATQMELWFGEMGSMSMVYSGSLITSWAVPGPLNYNTTYTWKVVGMNDTCSVSGSTWKFTTEFPPGVLFLEPFPNFDNWTEIGPLGVGNWSISNSNNAGGTAPELMCSWTPSFNGLSQVISIPINAPNNHNIELTGLLMIDHFADPAPFQGVAVTYDGGATSTTLYEAQSVGGDFSDAFTVDFVSPASGSENMQLIIYLNGDSFNIDFVYWDDIMLVDLDFVPVELTSFTAAANDADVTLNWSTATETNNHGFEVQRSFNGSEFAAVGFVDGNGTTTEIQNYSFTDRDLEVGSYTYRLKQVDLDGTYDYSNTVDVDVDIVVPDVFTLEQNYPNPFNPSTTIKFSLAVDSKVSLKVFDILGQEVTSLVNGQLTAGSHEINFNALNLNSGVYFYRIEANGVDGTNFTSVKKMILTK